VQKVAAGDALDVPPPYVVKTVPAPAGLMDRSTTETVSSGTRAILPGSLQKVWYSFQLGMSDLDRDGGD